MWYSFSVLIFDERKFTAGIGHEDSSNKEEMFRDYVSNSQHGSTLNTIFVMTIKKEKHFKAFLKIILLFLKLNHFPKVNNLF